MQNISGYLTVIDQFKIGYNFGGLEKFAIAELLRLDHFRNHRKEVFEICAKTEFGRRRYLSRVASDLGKTEYLLSLEPHEDRSIDFMDPLSVQKISDMASSFIFRIEHKGDTTRKNISNYTYGSDEIKKLRAAKAIIVNLLTLRKFGIPLSINNDVLHKFELTGNEGKTIGARTKTIYTKE